MIIIKNVSELNIDEIIECIKIYNETGESQMEGDILERIAELCNEDSEHQESTVAELKKRIKYSKSPLEVKMLNKKLNELYKNNKK